MKSKVFGINIIIEPTDVSHSGEGYPLRKSICGFEFVGFCALAGAHSSASSKDVASSFTRLSIEYSVAKKGKCWV